MTNEKFLDDLKFVKRVNVFDLGPALEHAKKLVDLADQVDALLSMAKRNKGIQIDDGDYWEISDDVFQEVQKAFEELEKE